MKNPDLTPEQKAVLFDKATEAPFSGALVYTFDTGDYTCANCGSTLFTSDTKFDSNCGWPSFDQAVEGAVKTETDTTLGMVRTEITCANCGGHLGHVFDDGPKETTGLRYCVNSLSLSFKPEK
jgi:peptide-methionine (R)-S-oxide reductase